MSLSIWSLILSAVLILVIFALVVPNHILSTRTCIRQSALVLVGIACLLALRGLYQSAAIFAIVGVTLAWYEHREQLERHWRLSQTAKGKEETQPGIGIK